MRTYQVWAGSALVHDDVPSLALALHRAHDAALASPEQIADVFQGSRFVASVDVDESNNVREPQGVDQCAA